MNGDEGFSQKTPRGVVIGDSGLEASVGALQV